MRFTWKLKGEYAPLFVALDKGYYKAEGLEVDLAEGSGAQTVLKLLASGNEKFGDYQSNGAMGLAKAQKLNPRAVAEQIKAKLDLGEMASEVSIAGPGFINVKLSPSWLASMLQHAGSDPRLGLTPTANPQTVVVDYSAPNIAKEMHVGHLRSTIIGDAISRVIEFRLAQADALKPEGSEPLGNFTSIPRDLSQITSTTGSSRFQAQPREWSALHC